MNQPYRHPENFDRFHHLAVGKVSSQGQTSKNLPAPDEEKLLAECREAASKAGLRQGFDIFLIQQALTHQVNSTTNLLNSEDQVRKFTEFFYGSFDQVCMQLDIYNKLPELPDQEKIKDITKYFTKISFTLYGLFAFVLAARSHDAAEDNINIEEFRLYLEIICGTIVTALAGFIPATKLIQEQRSQNKQRQKALIFSQTTPEVSKTYLSSALDMWHIYEEIQALKSAQVDQDEYQLGLFNTDNYYLRLLREKFALSVEEVTELSRREIQKVYLDRTLLKAQKPPTPEKIPPTEKSQEEYDDIDEHIPEQQALRKMTK
jgi:hypothetical protein